MSTIGNGVPAWRIARWADLYEPAKRYTNQRDTDAPLKYVLVRAHGRNVSDAYGDLQERVGDDILASLGMFTKCLEIAADCRRDLRDGTLWTRHGVPADLTKIAQYTRCSLELVTRCMRALVAEGWIEEYLWDPSSPRCQQSVSAASPERQQTVSAASPGCQQSVSAASPAIRHADGADPPPSRNAPPEAENAQAQQTEDLACRHQSVSAVTARCQQSVSAVTAERRGGDAYTKPKPKGKYTDTETPSASDCALGLSDSASDSGRLSRAELCNAAERAFKALGALFEIKQQGNTPQHRSDVTTLTAICQHVVVGPTRDEGRNQFEALIGLAREKVTAPGLHSRMGAFVQAVKARWGDEWVATMPSAKPPAPSGLRLASRGVPASQ